MECLQGLLFPSRGKAPLFYGMVCSYRGELLRNILHFIFYIDTDLRDVLGQTNKAESKSGIREYALAEIYYLTGCGIL